MPSPLRVHSALLAVSLLFGVNYVVVKQILTAVDPGTWTLFRITAATAVLVPLAARLGRPGGWPAARRWPALAIAAVFGVALNQILFAEGMARTTPEHSAVINACIPTWTLLAAAAAGQERLSPALLLAVATALAGVSYLLGVDRMLTGGAAPATGASLLGDLLTMANGMAFAVHLVLMRRLGRDLDPWFATAALFLLGCPLIAAWTAPSADFHAFAALLQPPLLWLSAFVVLGATVLTYLLNNWALRHTHSSQVALYINVQPLVAAAVHTALGAPPPGHRFCVALALVAGGLWLQTRVRR